MKYIYYPVYFILCLFILDKVFYLDFFQKEFIQEGNIVFYKQRELLFKRFFEDKEKEKKKSILVFGDSRAYGFSEEFLTSTQKEQYLLYNFSAPQSGINYALFVLEKIKKEKIKPNMIFLVLSPEGFDNRKGFIYDPFFRMAASREFIIKYWDYFPDNDKNEWIKDKFFMIKKIKPDLKLLINRFQNGNLSQYKTSINGEIAILNLTKGDFLGYQKVEKDTDKLKKDSIRLKNLYLNHFKITKAQFFFLEEFLKITNEWQSNVFLIWPRVYPDYNKYYEDFDFTNKWWKEVQKISFKYNAKTINFNKVIRCNFFYDASHQSTICFKPQLQYLLKRSLDF